MIFYSQHSNHTDLDLSSVILLDKIQKKQKISLEESKQLRAQKLVEVRYPNLYVVAEIAALTDDKSTYIRNGAFDKEHYKKLVISFIQEYGCATRRKIDKLLMDKLSDALDEKQKGRKLDDLLQEMFKKDLSIKNEGTSRKSKWVLNNN